LKGLKIMGGVGTSCWEAFTSTIFITEFKGETTVHSADADHMCAGNVSREDILHQAFKEKNIT
jgi:hypothetical protein